MAVIGPFENEIRYYGAAADVKPTADKGVKLGSVFYETDTSKRFVFLGGTTWTEITIDTRA
jgi:hypothetical protein